MIVIPDQCPDCGGEFISTARAMELDYDTEPFSADRDYVPVTHQAIRCAGCDLDLPSAEATVYFNGKTGVYHAKPECERAAELPDQTADQDEAREHSIPCLECFGAEE